MALAGDVVRVAVRAAQHALGRRQKVVAAQGAGKVHDASMCDGQRLFHCCERYLISRGSRRAGARRQVSLGDGAARERRAKQRATRRLRGRTRRPDISMRRGTHALSGATKAHVCASPRDAFCEICGTRSRFNSVPIFYIRDPCTFQKRYSIEYYISYKFCTAHGTPRAPPHFNSFNTTMRCLSTGAPVWQFFNGQRVDQQKQ